MESVGPWESGRIEMSHGFVYDVLGLGCTAVDDLLYVPSYPAPDSKIQVRQRERQCGGLTATALVAAARLGSRCAFAGVLGDDEESRFVSDCLSREGIDLTHVIRRDGARPIRSTIIVDDSERTRTILYDLSGFAGADPDRPPAEMIRSSRVLFVDHYGVEGMARAARIAREARLPVVADLERHDWPGFDQLLALVDHLILSRDFATTLTGISDPAKAVTALWTDLRQVVIVTCGEQGCYYREGGDVRSVHHQPAFPVAAVDTTGCGDVFHGAYASALARGLNLDDRIRFASAAAALKATRPGGQAGIPRREAVEALLAEEGPSGTDPRRC
jgi:sugar/nucleoside kinase (ribokinase family)